MTRSRSIPAALITLLLLAVTGALASPVTADTTATTGASVTVVDAGSLDVHWVSDDVQFLANGEAPAVTAAAGTTAPATFSLLIADTRAVEPRAGYEIRLSADTFTVSGSEQTLPASHLAVSDLSGLPEEINGSGVIGATLEGGVTVLTVPSGTAAVNTTLDITITMTIPAGTYPGTFNGGVSIEVIPEIQSGE